MEYCQLVKRVLVSSPQKLELAILFFKACWREGRAHRVLLELVLEYLDSFFSRFVLLLQLALQPILHLQQSEADAWCMLSWCTQLATHLLHLLVPLIHARPERINGQVLV